MVSGVAVVVVVVGRVRMIVYGPSLYSAPASRGKASGLTATFRLCY